MSYIRTFFKDIDPEDLGFTYSHEHIVCIPQYWKERNEDDLLLAGYHARQSTLSIVMGFDFKFVDFF